MWLLLVIFFFKQKTAYEMRISDWSSDVCSSDLSADREVAVHALARETLYPYIVAIQSFPKVAVAPLLVVWLGYGLLPKIAIGGLLAFFPIFASTLAGLLEVDKDEVDLFRSMRARWYHQLRYLRIPNALSYIFPARSEVHTSEL